MENQSGDSISRILTIVLEILEDVRYLKEHRSMLDGDLMLDFSEVCQILHQSERQVRRYREQCGRCLSASMPGTMSSNANIAMRIFTAPRSSPHPRHDRPMLCTSSAVYFVDLSLACITGFSERFPCFRFRNIMSASASVR